MSSGPNARYAPGPMVPDLLGLSPCSKMDATFPPGVPWKAKEILDSAPPGGRAAAIKRPYAAANCGLGSKELITYPDRWKARRIMCSTCMSTSPIDSGVCAFSCGVSSCCHSAKSVTMRAAPFSLLSCPSLHTHERETVSTHIRAACARRSVLQKLLTRWHPASPGHLPGRQMPPPPRHHALSLRLPPDCPWAAATPF